MTGRAGYVAGYVAALEWVVGQLEQTGPGESAQDATDDKIEARLREMKAKLGGLT